MDKTIFVATWEEGETSKVLCVGITFRGCLKLANKICREQKLDPALIELTRKPFNNEVGLGHNVDKYYTK